MNQNIGALALLKQEIAEKKRALQALEKALADYENQYPEIGSPLNAPASPQISFALDVDEHGRRKTLRDQIKDAIRQLGHREFDIGQVTSVLKSMHVEVKGKYPRNRITMTLRKLADEGLIKRTYIGSGSAPHRYKTSLLT